MHGSNWHPIIGPFGMMECVVCKCLKGQIDCGRLKCPPKKEMPCPKPVKVEGHCCPICNSMISNGKVETYQEIFTRSIKFQSKLTFYFFGNISVFLVSKK